MTVPTNILAEGPDLGWALSIIAFIVFAIIRAMVKRNQAVKEEQERQQGSTKPATDQQQHQEPRYRPVQTPPPPPRSDPLMRAMENLGIVQELPPEPPPLEESPTHSVQQEVRREELREAKVEAQRRKRLAANKSSEEDTAAIGARLVQTRSGTDGRYRGPSVTRGELTDPAAAREALIYHEIFSPPKALRDQPDLWEL